MKTGYKGLSASQIEKNRALYGANILTPPQKDPLWKQFMRKFKDPLIVILLVAGALSILISFYEYYGLHEGFSVFLEPVGIFLAIILATSMAFIFEYKADKEFAVLNRINDDEPVKVVRDSNVTEVPRKDIVVGDIVLIDTGEEIPADGVLLESVSLSVDESTLTGEPICVKTVVESEFDPEATFPSNHVLKGTKVMEGHGVMRVARVGDSTENGKVFTAAQIDSSVKTPLDLQLERLGRMISVGSYIVASLVVAGRLIMYFVNMPFDTVTFITYFLQTLMIAVTLVVVSVPEGLPMAVTLSLAYSMRSMLKTNNLVRKLHACETMGAATVICTDKTGTLTQNRMQVHEMDFYGDMPEDLINEGIAVNSTAQLDTQGDEVKVVGNPTEGALLLWLAANGEDYSALKKKAEVLDEIPFSTERKYMATLVKSASGRRILYVKGAPEIVISLCGVIPEGVSKDEINRRLLGFQNQGMRTLAFAWQPVEDGQTVIENGRLTTEGLIFSGIAAISDPVRTDVPSAVREVREAGVDVKIVTGDTPATAREIGREIGLWDDRTDSDRNIISGVEVENLSDEELRRRAPELKIICRARPMDKKRLVMALQEDGEVVAVTGDGTNDAPALKTAQVGLSMGDGTAVAKESSDITIIDNSFRSIVRAVMWGRSLYKNIQRFILFQLTVNVVACLIVLVGSFMGMQSPLTVTQMLWVNLIMDTFAAMALASLPPSESVMKEKPRSRSAFIITPSMWRFIFGVGLVFFVLLWSLLYYFEHTDLTSLTQIGKLAIGVNKGLSPYELSLFFTIFVYLQFWNLFNAKAYATGRSALHFRNCRGFCMIALIIGLGQILIVTAGGVMFNVVPLKLTDWVIIIVSTSMVLWVGGLIRLLERGGKRD